MDSIPHGLSLNTGLTDIRLAEPLDGVELPQLSSIAPSDEAMEGQLARLLETPTMDSRILSALRPLLRSRDILAPSRYAALAEDAPIALADLAQTLPEGEEREAVLAAASQLREENALRDLLAMLRHALHRA